MSVHWNGEKTKPMVQPSPALPRTKVPDGLISYIRMHSKKAQKKKKKKGLSKCILGKTQFPYTDRNCTISFRTEAPE